MNDSVDKTGRIRWFETNTFGLTWLQVVLTFIISNALHLSGLASIFAQEQRAVKQFKRSWFSYSWPVTTHASSTNWSQFLGGRDASCLYPSWEYSSFRINWVKMLTLMLNVRGLKQSPWRTPIVTGINGVAYPVEMIDVLKSVYKSFIRLLFLGLDCDGPLRRRYEDRVMR